MDRVISSHTRCACRIVRQSDIAIRAEVEVGGSQATDSGDAFKCNLVAAGRDDNITTVINRVVQVQGTRGTAEVQLVAISADCKV